MQNCNTNMGHNEGIAYTDDSKSSPEAAVILRDHPPDDIVKAIIQGDKQEKPFFIFDMDVAYRYIQLFRKKCLGFKFSMFKLQFYKSCGQVQNCYTNMGHNEETAHKNDSKSSSEAAFILSNQSPDDVVKAIIQGDRQKEPFFIFDMDVAYRYIQLIRKKMPKVQVFYAMKSNDSAMMLKLAVTAGLGFDCASPGEIYKIRQLNVSPTSIIFALPTKTPEQMQYARQSGVRHTTFDGSTELKKLKQYWPDARLLIRIRVASDSMYQLGDKFGCDFETEARALLDEAADLGLRVIGVAFHVGSVCSSVNSYVIGLQQAKALFEYEAKVGRRMEIVDIGGGFFGQDLEKFEAVSDVINTALEEFFPDPNVQIIAEPGRFLSEPAFILYCNIKDVRKTITDDKQLKTLYINDGLNGSLCFLEKWHHIQLYGKSSITDEELEDTVLYGPTADYRDLVVDVKLPKCSIQNWLVIKSLGSYTIVFASRYNCFEGIKIRPLISMKLWSIIKSSSVFEASDFIFNPDISAPLPSSIPNVIDNQVLVRSSYNTQRLI